MFENSARRHSSVKNDLLSGLTVALALVPEAVAFALIAGVQPLVGLYAAFMVGLITSVMGGRPGMISGATGALAVVMVSLVANHGVQYLFATVVLMGLLHANVGRGIAYRQIYSSGATPGNAGLRQRTGYRDLSRSARSIR